jgi:RNA polymerase sigma-70 factor (ECF subfamily)
LRNFGSFRGDEKQFRNWLYKIATNSINNHLRKAARKKTLIEAISQTANNQVVDCSSSKQQSEENFALLRKAMFELKPRYQTIITLRFFENLKLTEIAEVLSSRPGTVRSQLARALAKLRKKLDSIWCED